MEEMQQLAAVLLSAAQQGDQQAIQQLQQILQLAQQGDQQAMKMMQIILQLSQSAKNGAKLNYILRLRGKCPEGYELEYFKAGGKVCSKCMKKAAKACGGKKMENGGSMDPDYITAFKAKCGGKVEKHEKSNGNKLEVKTSLDKMYKKSEEKLSNGNRRVYIVGQNDDPKDIHTADITAKGDTARVSPGFKEADKHFKKKK